MIPKDYLQDDDFDLLITNGDLTVGESTEQHQRDLLLQNYGDDRLLPILGVGITNFINDDNFGDIKAEIRKQFELDGMEINTLNVYEDGTLEIDAEYK